MSHTFKPMKVSKWGLLSDCEMNIYKAT